MFTNPFWTNFASMRPRLRLIEGGDNGGAGGGDGAGGDNSGGAGGAGAADQGAQGGQPGAGDQGAQETPEQTIARLTSERDTLAREKENVRIRQEGAIKAEAKRTELLSLAKVLGTDGIEDSMTIEQITEKITGKVAQAGDTDAQASTLRTTAVNAALVQEAWTQQVDPTKGDYLAFKVSQNPAFATLDPSADDFKTKISSLVKSTVESDPVFRPAQAGSGGNGGGDHGGSGGANEITKEAFDSMDVKQKTDLFNNHRETFNRLVNS